MKFFRVSLFDLGKNSSRCKVTNDADQPLPQCQNITKLLILVAQCCFSTNDSNAHLCSAKKHNIKWRNVYIPAGIDARS